MARDYHEEYERRNELAHERGFESLYAERQEVAHVRDIFGDLSYGDAVTLAEFGHEYDPGDMTRDELAEWYEDNFGPIDYDDPEDPFWDWLDALSGEGAA